MKYKKQFLFCQPFRILKRIPLKKIFFLLFTSSLFLPSCKKDSFIPPIKEESWVLQTGNPAGRSYTSDSLISFTCTAKHCGILPLSTKNYWIYEDSVFSDGVFQKVQYDTLRFHKTWKSLSDELVWWESNISIGLPDKLYAMIPPSSKLKIDSSHPVLLM